MARQPKNTKTRKSAPKRLAKDIAISDFQEASVPSSNPLAKLPRKYTVAILVLIILAAIVYNFKSLFVVAIVNGQPITHVALVQELEKQAGAQTLNGLVTKTLILQQAQKQHVTVSDKEVADEIKKIDNSLSKQGQKLDQLLLARNMTKSDLMDQIKIQKIVEKILAKNIIVSDKEVNEYIANNKSSLPANQNENDLKKTVHEQLKQQKLQTKAQEWVMELQRNAKIMKFVNF